METDNNGVMIVKRGRHSVECTPRPTRAKQPPVH